MNRPIAIALDYPLALRGGVSVIVESLLENLTGGYDITLVSPDESSELKKHPAFSRIKEHLKFNATTLSPSSSQGLVEELVRRKIPLVHFHAGGNLEWGNRSRKKSPLPRLTRAGIRSIFSAHQVLPLLEGYCAKERSIFYKLALLPPIWLAANHALRNTSHIITDSRFDAEQFKRSYPLLAKKTGFIYHSRLNASEQPPTDALREKTILSVGHVAFRKGQHILAEAFTKIAPQFPDWKLVIAGPVLQKDCGDKITALITAHKLQDRLQLAGAHRTPQDLMRRAEIFAQPSLTEAFGLALQEAMFFGCACVGSDTGGIPELITHGQTGLLCPAGDVEALAHALSELMRDPARRSQLANNARASIRQRGMTGQAMAANYERLYQEVLTNP